MKQFYLVFFCTTISFSALGSFKENYWQPAYENHILPTLHDGFDKTGWWILGSGTALTLFSLQYDDDIRQFWEGKDRLPEDINNVANELGSGRTSLLILAMQLGFDRENGWAHLETLIGVRISKTLIKRTVRRKRPSGDERDTFPSGHVSTVFATVTSLTYAYGWWAGVPGYTIGILSAASRLNDTRHFFSDLVMGAVLGIFWGRASYHHHDSKIEITPEISSQDAMLYLKYRY